MWVLFVSCRICAGCCEWSTDVFWPFLPTLWETLAKTQHSRHFYFFGWELAFTPAAVCVLHLCMCVSVVRGNRICDPMRQKGKVCFSIAAFSPFVEMWAHCVDHPHFPQSKQEKSCWYTLSHIVKLNWHLERKTHARYDTMWKFLCCCTKVKSLNAASKC